MYPNLYAAHERAHHDYDSRITKGLLRRLYNLLRQQPTDLLDYESVVTKLHVTGQHDAGVKVISVKQIVGSVGRTHDFDREFYPLHDKSRDRWVGVAGAMYEGKALPPIDLYKIHETYFVIDGNHRVSVMRQNGQEYVEAHIIELDTSDCINIHTGEPSTCHCDN